MGIIDRDVQWQDGIGAPRSLHMRASLGQPDFGGGMQDSTLGQMTTKYRTLDGDNDITLGNIAGRHMAFPDYRSVSIVQRQAYV